MREEEMASRSGPTEIRPGPTVLLPRWCWWRWGLRGWGLVWSFVCVTRGVCGGCGVGESRNRGLQMSGGTEGDRDYD
eukprot:scaffold7584_cov53-Phaeocystis_antarctica.AAC.4